jgi:hypothetical protein
MSLSGEGSSCSAKKVIDQSQRSAQNNGRRSLLIAFVVIVSEKGIANVSKTAG